MARTKTNTKRVPVTLPSGSLFLLDQLVGKKTLGETRAQVAAHLLIATLDALVERKRIHDVPVNDEEPGQL
jgi:hypothetical protein